MTGVGFGSLTDKRVWKKAMRHISEKDGKLGRVIAKRGAISSNWGPADPYEAIVESFIYQQIAGSAADAILKKFKGLYGGRLPKPREFLSTSEKKVRSAGISPQKYSYIKDLCQRLVDKELDLNGLSRLPDEEVIAILDDVRGIGRWTAEMFLMFSLKRVDVFPADDLGIQNGMKKVYNLRSVPNRKRMLEMSERWRPYRTIASLYLWRSQDSDEE
ncbi:MAG: DNA-3-methyladenine glycosylase 2 family protein [Candidatus Micrarchaeota archaeon]|nr:DNA-3-methyladenine glycosylase 2 family protein [Candidatus Micrarchaeota archaeon]